MRRPAAFAGNRNRTVILLVRDIGNPFYLEIFKGVEESAGAAGYKVLMGDARNDEARIVEHVDLVRQRHADGLILMTGHLPADLIRHPERLPPLVVASEPIPGLDMPMVRIDSISASRQAVQYLLEKGHRRIAHLGGPAGESLAAERREGYRQALAGAGLSPSPELETSGDYSVKAGRRGVRDLLDAGHGFTAIFAASDQMAIGAISELRRRGLAVPADISVIGFDDIIFADVFEPGLTTVRQPRHEMGRQAMALMVARLAGEPVKPVVQLETELVIRGSVAALGPAETAKGSA
ncbi:MAG: substrate-binding domain-containing protein [Micropruina sp.]|uniref:substrate-binding domain-containing protein n=1 Tax=Micropruina sp. TaxID=2737536 RepID=UPI0039E4712C